VGLTLSLLSTLIPRFPFFVFCLIILFFSIFIFGKGCVCDVVSKCVGQWKSVVFCVANRKVLYVLCGRFSQHFNYNYILLYYYHLKKIFQNLVQAPVYTLLCLHPSLSESVVVKSMSKRKWKNKSQIGMPRHQNYTVSVPHQRFFVVRWPQCLKRKNLHITWLESKLFFYQE